MFSTFDFEFRFSRSLDSLIPSGVSTLVAAVSGGVDSMVMLWLLAQRLGSDRLVVAHCNFGLRGEEADQESRMVEEFCRERGIRFEMARFDTYSVCSERGEGIQVVARDLRYEFFEKVTLEYGAEFVAIAHNSDDVTETFFINMMRGSGLRGLLSIPQSRGNIIRPLIFASRSEILLYAQGQGIPYRDDSSNLDTKYLRNKLRHLVLPQLRSIRSDFDQKVRENITRLSSSLDFENRIISRVLGRVYLDGRFDIRGLLAEESFCDYLLYQLLRPWGFSWDSCRRICGDISQGRGQGNIYISSQGFRALIDRGFLVIAPLADTHADSRDNSRDDRTILAQDVAILSREDVSSLKAGSDFCYFDFSQLRFPLTLRLWRPSDRIRPYGMKGRSKLVSDLLVDSKLSRFDKESQQLLVDSSGEVLWVVGLRSSECCSVTPQTTKVARLEL